MKDTLRHLVLTAARRAFENGRLTSGDFPAVEIAEPKHAGHGDFSTNLAMVMARSQKMAPVKIARAIVDHIADSDDLLAECTIAGPGFINLFLKPRAWHPLVRTILTRGSAYGTSDAGRGRRVQVEFVSSNPTGPLHVGHGRGAAVGDSTANILAACGYRVQREYYINDSGRQIRTLGRSVALRCRELLGETVTFPDECYQGEYIRDYAAQLVQAHGGALLEDDPDEVVARCARHTAGRIVARIRDDLERFGVRFDNWYSEQSLYDSGKVAEVLERYAARGLIYDKDGARWFRSSDFGDEKDRVVVRANGQTTYFASDIAYHEDKFDRGFEWLIDVWGADHHGYIPRVAAAVRAGGHRREQFDVILVQLVNLLRDGEPVAMSTRAGQFVTLEEVVQEVGRDAARFIFLTRSADSPLDFDLAVAARRSNDNPVYYVQYVHARIASIVRKAAAEGMVPADPERADLQDLTAAEELNLLKSLMRFPEVVQLSARQLEPHRVTFYLMDLAGGFHSYYNKHRVLVDDPRLSGARLALVAAVQQVIRNGLHLLGVRAPERM